MVACADLYQLTVMMVEGACLSLSLSIIVMVTTRTTFCTSLSLTLLDFNINHD